MTFFLFYIQSRVRVGVKIMITGGGRTSARQRPVGGDANRGGNRGETVPATQLQGSYQTQWNAANMSNGIYLYNIKVNNKRFNGKMVKI